VKRVVGDQTVPDEIPERVDGLCRIAGADRGVQRFEKRRAALAQVVDDGGFAGVTVRLKPDTT